jgi:hypothetical protein
MEKLKITLEDWDYTCGAYLYLNGDKLEHPNPQVHDNSYIGMDVENSLEAVLKKLGYEVEFEHKHED